MKQKHPSEGPDRAILAAHDANEYYTALSFETQESKPALELLELLGAGPSGRVFKARWAEKKDLVAVKIVDVKEREWHGRQRPIVPELKEEVNAINNVSYYGASGFLETFDVIPFADTVWLPTPLCTGGNLKTLMEPRGYLPNKYIVTVMRDVTKALFWVYAQGNFHGNVKAANVLLNEKGSVRLCDFSLIARGQLSAPHSESAYNGSIHWLAPEYLVDHYEYHKSVDVWSLGALAYELATGAPPNFGLRSAAAIHEHINRVGPPRLVGNEHADGLKAMTAMCFVIDPEERPTMSEVFMCPYISDDGEGSSLQELVEEYHQWRRGGVVEVIESSVTAHSHAEEPLEAFPTLPEEPSPSDSDGDLSAWSVFSDPSRCSSPFDLEYLALPIPASTTNEPDATASYQGDFVTQASQALQSSMQTSDTSRDVSITVGMDLAQTRASNATRSSVMRLGSALPLDFDMVFNPAFDIFASESSTGSPTTVSVISALDDLDLANDAPLTSASHSMEPSQMTPRARFATLWDSPPLSPSSSPTRRTQRLHGAILPNNALLPAMTYQPQQPQYLNAPSRDSVVDDDDGTATLRPRNSYQTAPVLPADLSTPPTTPERKRTRAKEPASSPHAWPPFRHVPGSEHDFYGKPMSPSPTKPLPAIPSLSFPQRSFSTRTAGNKGSSDISPSRTAPAPPMPIVPCRPSVDIFSPVSCDVMSSFDANGMYIPRPSLPSPSQQLPPQPGSAQATLALHQREGISVAQREKMIPREAGSCPAPFRRSHPAATSKRTTSRCLPMSCSTSAIPPSSSSTSSSPTKPPPRNASFSFFPSQAISRQAYTVHPPRRPSEPLPNQQSFFDHDAHDDSDSEDYESARLGGAADLKKGFQRLVIGLGGTIRGLETAPRKGLRFLKRSSP